MINLGLLHFFFSIQVLQMHDGIFLSQPKYVMDLLNQFKMDDYKVSVASFQSKVKLTKEFDSLKASAILYGWLVGILIYLTHNRPKISFIVSVISHLM